MTDSEVYRTACVMLWVLPISNSEAGHRAYVKLTSMLFWWFLYQVSLPGLSFERVSWPAFLTSLCVCICPSVQAVAAEQPGSGIWWYQVLTAAAATTAFVRTGQRQLQARLGGSKAGYWRGHT